MFWTKKKEASLGVRGEDIAVNHLKKNGYSILERNYRNKKGYQIGEIDIIAQKGDKIYFVEVKTRTVKDLANHDEIPEENITRHKLNKIERTCHDYLYYKGRQNNEHQIDAISIIMCGNKHEIKHLECIFI